ncbi:MAG: leucine-rich repeat protein, partial [Mycoplasma sp.]
LVSGINIDSSSKLTKIADNAFRNLTSLVGTITLPSKVDYVGESAFENTNITNLVFNSTLLRTISKNSFKNCKQLRVDLTIPASIYYIEEGAFNGSGIKSIVYNSALREIRKEAFANCSSLVTMNEMPNTLNAIGDLVFANDTNLSLSSYNIKDSIKDFGNSIFSGVSKTNISVPAFWDDQPEGWIKGYAGQYQVRRSESIIVNRQGYDKTRTTTEINSILTDGVGVGAVINKSILNEYIDINTFPDKTTFKLKNSTGASSYTSIVITYDFYYDSNGNTKNANFTKDVNLRIDYETWDVFKFDVASKAITGLADNYTTKNGWNNGNITIPTKYQGYSVLKIGGNAFSSNQDIKSVSFSKGITSIDTGAFNSSYNISGTLVLPETLTFLGEGSLANLRGNITELHLPKSMKNIDLFAFHNSYGIKSKVTFSEGLENIGDYAFAGTSGLRGDLTLPNSLANLGFQGFMDSGFDGKLTIGNKLTTIRSNTFARNKFIGDLIIPDNIITIEEWGFNSSSNDGKLIMSKNLKTLGNSVFNSSYNLIGDLVIPNSIEVIGEGTFANLRSMAGTITLPSNLKTLVKFAFHNSGSFTGSLTIPNGTTTIQVHALSGLESIDGTIYIPNSVVMPTEPILAYTGTPEAVVSVPKSWTSVPEHTGWRQDYWRGVIGRDSKQEQQAQPKKDKVVNTEEIIKEISNLKYFLFKKDN